MRMTKNIRFVILHTFRQYTYEGIISRHENKKK